MLTPRTSYRMAKAIGYVQAGETPARAAELAEVGLQGLYRALRRGLPRCPTCGRSQRRSAAGLARDVKAARRIEGNG